MAPYRQRTQDWLFGSRVKHAILEKVLLTREREGVGWTRAELAKAIGQHPKARLDLCLGPLVELGLLTRESGRYQLVENSPLASPLRDLIAVLQQVDTSKPG